MHQALPQQLVPCILARCCVYVGHAHGSSSENQHVGGKPARSDTSQPEGISLRQIVGGDLKALLTYSSYTAFSGKMRL